MLVCNYKYLKPDKWRLYHHLSDQELALSGNQGNVVIFGLSSEGYSVACKLSVKGYKVSIIDETLGTTMHLRPEIAADYGELKKLMAEETLLEMSSQKTAIANARVVFFAPKIRRRQEDILSEVRTRVTELGKNLSGGALVVF